MTVILKTTYITDSYWIQIIQIEFLITAVTVSLKVKLVQLQWYLNLLSEKKKLHCVVEK